MGIGTKEVMLLMAAALVGSVLFIMALGFSPFVDRAPGYVAQNLALTVDSISAAPENAHAKYILPRDDWTASSWWRNENRVVSKVIMQSGGGKIEVSRFGSCEEAGVDITDQLGRFIGRDTHHDEIMAQTQSARYHRFDSDLTKDMYYTPDSCKIVDCTSAIHAIEKVVRTSIGDQVFDHFYDSPNWFKFEKKSNAGEDNNQIRVEVECK